MTGIATNAVFGQTRPFDNKEWWLAPESKNRIKCSFAVKEE